MKFGSGLAALLVVTSASAFVVSPRVRPADRLRLAAQAPGDGFSAVVRLRTPPSTEALLARKERQVTEAVAPAEVQEAQALQAEAAGGGDLGVLQIQEPSSNPLVARWQEFSRERPMVGPALAAGAIWGGLTIASVADKKMKAYHERQLKNIEHYGLEMARYMGQLEMLKEVHEDHAKILGPGHKTRSFFASYLALALSKVNISGASLKEFAFVISLNKLQEREVAETFVEVAQGAGTELMTSKVLFFAERLVTTPDALEALRPLRKELSDRFQGNAELVKMSQENLALQAFEFFVRQEPDVEKRSEEGRLLGFTADKIKTEISNVEATIAEEEEALRAAEAEKQAAMDAEAAKRIAQAQAAAAGGFADDTPKAAGPGVALPSAEVAGADGSGALVATCQKCGYKLFVAKGREERQFGDDFKCPQCGAPKSDFTQSRR